MEIIRIKILSPFRGLPEGYEIKFDRHKNIDNRNISPICFVGLNGSGKSNVLEVIAEIFYYLETYNKAPLEKLESFKSGFGFEIEYKLSKNAFDLGAISWPELMRKWENSKEDPVFLIVKPEDAHPQITAVFSDRKIVLLNKDYNRNAAVLPTRLIAYSSGMNELLSNPFIKIDFQYFDELRSNTGESGNSIQNMNRMFFLNYDSNKFITVCNFLFDATVFDRAQYRDANVSAQDFGGINLKHIKNELNIVDLKSFTITLRLKKMKKAKEYLPAGLNLVLDNLILCSTFHNEKERQLKNEVYRDVELIYNVNNATKEAFRYYFKRADDLFQKFYFLNLLNNELLSANLRHDIAAAKSGTYENLSDELPKFETDKLIFRIHDISFSKKGKQRIHYRKLSDGEHQLLQVFGTLLLIDTEGALFLLDEPETHFNPDWRSRFVDLANESIDKERNQEIILTTHSPYIVSDCKKENVYIFQKNQDGSIGKPSTPKINTFGTSISILTDEVFGKEDTISELPKKKIEEILKMPKSTLAEIQAAKEASRVLGESFEKVMLFKKLISKENELKK